MEGIREQDEGHAADVAPSEDGSIPFGETGKDDESDEAKWASLPSPSPFPKLRLFFDDAKRKWRFNTCSSKRPRQAVVNLRSLVLFYSC